LINFPYNVFMSEALLQTKLFVPPLRPNLVNRSRLEERLDRGIEQGSILTLVTGPAGFGKTTFISSWIHHQSKPAAWLSLDERDNSTNRFIFYLISALQTIDQDLGEAAVSLLQSPQPPPPDTLLTLLINDLTTLPEQVLLVLDDYHVINNLEIHQALTFLLNHPPQQLHLIIVSREDPALPLHQLRGSGQMTGIYVRDLRFTIDEATQFIAKTMGMNLADEDIAVLERKTEGWVAGLQLAALSMQDTPDSHQFLIEFAGDDRYISDYLIGEVFERQPRAVQDFLLKTAILDRFSASLAEAIAGIGELGQLTGDPDQVYSSQTIIEHLDQANLFIISLDNKREWYRYHHLFADFLQMRLRDLPDDEIDDLHHDASLWYEENGFLAEAIQHALGGGDFERAAQMIEQNALTTIFGLAQWATLLQWVEALPENIVRSSPQLSLQYAWALFTMGDWKKVEPVLQSVEAAIGIRGGAGSQNLLLGEVVTLQAWLAFETDKMQQSINLAKKALELLPEEELMIRSLATLAQGAAQFWLGQLHNSRETLQAAINAGIAADNLAATVSAMGILVQMEVGLGNLRKASELYEMTRKRGTINGVALLSPTGYACVQMGDVLREWNQLQQATRLLEEGIKLCRQAGVPEFALEGQVILARVLLADGDELSAANAMGQVDSDLRTWVRQGGNVQYVITPAFIQRVRYWLASGEISKAADWLEKNGIQGSENVAPGNEIEHLLLARVLIARGRQRKALPLLKNLLQLVENGEEKGAHIETLVLMSIALEADGEPELAFEKIFQALELAEPEGYQRIFIDTGAKLQNLLNEALRDGERQDYIESILAAIQSEEKLKLEKRKDGFTSRKGVRMDEPIEQLTEQERHILKLIAGGLSNRQIAAELFLSINTIKTYTSRIYSKLAVHRRAEAVDRAHELGLL
jgi:LuxR family maltose regulon positive regulatory protein